MGSAHVRRPSCRSVLPAATARNRGERPGRRCEIRVRAKAIDYDAEAGTVTIEDGEVLQAHLVVVADGLYLTAVEHILGDDGVVEAGDTG